MIEALEAQLEEEEGMENKYRTKKINIHRRKCIQFSESLHVLSFTYDT